MFAVWPRVVMCLTMFLLMFLHSRGHRIASSLVWWSVPRVAGSRSCNYGDAKIMFFRELTVSNLMIWLYACSCNVQSEPTIKVRKINTQKLWLQMLVLWLTKKI